MVKNALSVRNKTVGNNSSKRVGDLALLHLLIPSVFKTLVFKCAGFVIHLYGKVQDNRFMQNTSSMRVPFLCEYFILTNLYLCRIPFLKDDFTPKILIYWVSSIHVIRLFLRRVHYLTIGMNTRYSLQIIFLWYQETLIIFRLK